jgi:ABC-type Fe3+-hydroxamate transport system substrate-binding protein
MTSSPFEDSPREPTPHPDGGWLDNLGTHHRLTDKEARIVSLVPSITELLFDLGLGPQLVGRTTFCIHPVPEVAAVRRVGGTKTVNLQKLEDMTPTHVIVNIDENRLADVEAMKTFVPNVIVTHPVEPHDNVALYAMLGGIFDREARAEVLIARYRSALESLQRRRAEGRFPHRQALYLIWHRPWMTVAPETYISRMLSLVDIETVPSEPENRYPEVEITEALLETLDWVLLSSEPFPFKSEHVAALRAEFPAHENKFRLIDGEMISWYGSRAIRGLEYLGEFSMT